ncbi:hypothetical protein GCM10020254_68510 [Streptomyces goshikiensis]
MSCSRAPAWAEWRTRETSSPGVRAEAISSVGSTPSARTSRLATAFRPAMTGRKAREKTCWGAGDDPGDLERPGDGPVLRDEFSDDHLDG